MFMQVLKSIMFTKLYSKSCYYNTNDLLFRDLCYLLHSWERQYSDTLVIDRIKTLLGIGSFFCKCNSNCTNFFEEKQFLSLFFPNLFNIVFGKLSPYGIPKVI